METALNTPKVSFEDFYEVPNLKFDIDRLRKDLEIILKEKKFNTPGVTHFGAIPLNQIPNDMDSINGNKIRGKYWTIADESEGGGTRYAHGAKTKGKRLCREAG